MNRIVLITLATMMAGAAGASFAAAPPTRPNIVLIMADDLGYETLGANGGTSYRTPHLDKLAATGVRGTQCYAQPLCTPTRVQLMTGLSNARNYINFGYMDPQAVTFAKLLKDAGYSTCMAGKWQLGHDVNLPKAFGFDEYCLWQHTRRPPRYANPGLEINGVEKDFTQGEYGPDIVNDFALDFITRHKAEPFLLYYPMMLTHAPYQPTPDSADWNPKALGEKENDKKPHFGDMVGYMDKLVGKLVERLDSLGLRENTLVIFLGDNGTGKGVESKLGGRTVVGGKGETTIAGMHVPLVANWPGTIRPGAVIDDLVDTTDFLPTLLAAAGQTPPAGMKFDGLSFLPQLRGESSQRREWLYCWYSPHQNENTTVHEFAFDQKYKLYQNGKFFDLVSDPQEKHPLAKAALAGERVAAAEKLQGAIDQFKGARPAELDRLGKEKAPAKKKKNKSEDE